MANRKVGRNSWFTILLVVVAVALWINEQRKQDPGPRTPGKSAPGAPADGVVEHTGAYETYRGCRLSEAHNNDGDSFEVTLPDGRTHVLRLYFVDTPESAFKRYRNGETNRSRIVRQARDLGGITPEQAVEAGVAAKHLTLGLLEEQPFAIHTTWDSPYHDQRYHAFVEVGSDGRTRLLHEVLVERGLARILTKPADLPDGTKSKDQLRKLRDLEKQARAAQVGAWGM